MTSKPVISVALATYNGAAYLREQLDSIFTPCSVVYEVVAADDGSTDTTREILGEYARKRGLRDVSDGRRRGLVKNFEHVLRHCRGEFVALCDQDDVWVPGRLDFLLRAIGKADAVYSLIDRVILPGGVIGQWSAPAGMAEYVARYGTGQPTAHLIASNWVISHTMLLRRDVLEAALPIPATQPYHDAWLAIAASARGGIRAIAPSQTLYRQHAASHTAAAALPPTRRILGRQMGLSRESWMTKCRDEIARLGDLSTAAFVAERERGFIARLLAYYERGLRGGLDLRAGWRARELTPYFFSSVERRWRRNFILRGFLGAI